MRIYENPEKTSMNRLPPRSYYIPGGRSQHMDLNGTWNFAFFSRDIDVPETIEKWDTIPVPSCWQLHGYEDPNYYYRPRKNIVNRPVSRGGLGWHFVGDHQETIPNLYDKIVEKWNK